MLCTEQNGLIFWYRKHFQTASTLSKDLIILEAPLP